MADRPPFQSPDTVPGDTDSGPVQAAAHDGDGASAARLQPGAKVGTRFVIEQALRVDELGGVYAAKDDKTGRVVSLRVMDAALAPGEDALGALRVQVKAAAAAQHKNVAATYGMGRAGAFLYVAGEHVDGTPLSVLLERKRDSGKPFSVRGAYNVVAHACNAIDSLPGGVHGRLCVDTLQVQRNGRVKLVDVGLAAGTVGFARRSGIDSALLPYLAPEARTPPFAPTAAADVYALGVVFFQMLAGRVSRGPESLSMARGDVPASADAVMFAALADDPAARPATVTTFKEALQAALGAALVSEEGEADDAAKSPKGDDAAKSPKGDDAAKFPKGDDAASARGAAAGLDAAAGSESASPAGAGAKPAKPRVGMRMAADQVVARPGVAFAVEPATSSFDVGSALPLDENIEKQERWLVCKGSEDWGPFSAEELRNQVRKLRVTEHDMIEDRETGDRYVLNEIPYFQPFIAAWRPERARQIEEGKRQAVIRRARNVRLTIIGGVVAGALGVAAVAVYAIYGPKPVKDRGESYPLEGAAVVRLLAANMTDDPTETLKAFGAKVPKELLKLALAKKKGTGKKKKWASGYDDSETISLEVSDDEGDEGVLGGEPLAAGELMSGWNSVFPEVKRCLLAEAGRSGKRAFVVRFTVQPNGSTKGIRLKGHTGSAGETCVKGAVSTAKFPTNSVPTPVDWPVKI